MMQQGKLSAMIVTLAFAGLFLLSTNLLAGWQIEYGDSYFKAMRNAGIMVSKRVGYFATKKQCEEAIDQEVARLGEHVRQHMYPAPGGYDDPDPGSAEQSDGGRRRLHDEQDASAAQHAELERQVREKELARQQEFERERDKLASQLKGSSTLALKGSSTLALKPSSALRQLESVAGSSQQAAGTATSSQPDPARPQSEFVASNASRIPASSVPVPEPQTPVARLKEYVIREKKIAADRQQALLREWQNARKAVKTVAEQRQRKNNQLRDVKQELVSLPVINDPPPEVKDRKDSLEAEAEALLAEVEALNKQVQVLSTQEHDAREAERTQSQWRYALQAALTTAGEPEQAEELLRKLQEEKP